MKGLRSVAMVLVLASCGGEAGPSDSGPAGECGDLVVQTGEECDDGNDEAFDGCGSDCTFSCHFDAECVDPDICQGARTCSSASHVCQGGAPVADGTGCTAGTVPGVCSSGHCVGAGCGNSMVAANENEQCDDGGNGNDADGCTDACQFTCELWSGHTNVLAPIIGAFEPPGVSQAEGWDWPDPLTNPVWFGDATQIVGASLGITPIDTRMLQFQYTGLAASTLSTSGAAYVYDLTPVADQVATGTLRAHLNAHFNRVSASMDPPTDTQFTVAIRAYDAARVELPARSESIESDNILSSWQCLRVSLVLPSNAAYIRVKVSAVENAQNEDSGEEFAGHFVDDVALWFDP
jgi:cysteine-rich repeat protein